MKMIGYFYNVADKNNFDIKIFERQERTRQEEEPTTSDDHSKDSVMNLYRFC